MFVTVGELEPGNDATKYLFIHGLEEDGRPFFCRPSLKRTAALLARPRSWEYLERELGLSEGTAMFLCAYLKTQWPELARLDRSDPG